MCAAVSYQQGLCAATCTWGPRGFRKRMSVPGHTQHKLHWTDSKSDLLAVCNHTVMHEPRWETMEWKENSGLSCVESLPPSLQLLPSSQAMAMWAWEQWILGSVQPSLTWYFTTLRRHGKYVPWIHAQTGYLDSEGQDDCLKSECWLADHVFSLQIPYPFPISHIQTHATCCANTKIPKFLKVWAGFRLWRQLCSCPL